MRKPTISAKKQNRVKRVEVKIGKFFHLKKNIYSEPTYFVLLVCQILAQSGYCIEVK